MLGRGHRGQGFGGQQAVVVQNRRKLMFSISGTGLHWQQQQNINYQCRRLHLLATIAIAVSDSSESYFSYRQQLFTLSEIYRCYRLLLQGSRGEGGGGWFPGVGGIALSWRISYIFYAKGIFFFCFFSMWGMFSFFWGEEFRISSCSFLARGFRLPWRGGLTLWEVLLAREAFFNFVFFNFLEGDTFG